MLDVYNERTGGVKDDSGFWNQQQNDQICHI